MIITIVNKSTVIKDTDVLLMVKACNILVGDLATAWNLKQPTIIFNSNKNATGNWYFYMVDSDSSVPNALAYHTQTNKLIVGYVLSQTILNYGGVILYKDTRTTSIAAALFHEIAEALLDGTVNVWWQAPTNILFAAEVCDPVQNIIIPVMVDNITVGLSDFIYPSWKDSNILSKNPKAQICHSGILKNPFTITSGGYYIKMNPSSGVVSQVFGSMMQDWVVNAKMNSNRFDTRIQETNSNTNTIRHAFKKIEHIRLQKCDKCIDMDADGVCDICNNCLLHTK